MEATRRLCSGSHGELWRRYTDYTEKHVGVLLQAMLDAVHG